MKDTNQLRGAVSFELVQAEKRSQFNPLKGLSPEKLSTYLDEFRAGHVQNLARVMDAIEERDDLLACVVPKTKAAVCRHGWEVLTVNTQTTREAALAERQKAELEHFYNNLSATSAMDMDEAGGMSLLLRQMMDAKGKRYCVHNIVWRPQGGSYSAQFIQVPLWFFENTTGRMRFISQPFGFYGETMRPGEWLVTRGTGLMIACSVAYMYKRMPLRDWLVYCGRHGIPGIEGITDAPEGSDEWNKLVEAVKAAKNEFAWVRSRSSEIKTVDFGADGTLPFPPLVERMDRAMTAIWRGGDLGTMSKDSAAVGSNPQGSETINIEEDDAAWLSETLNLKVDRLVLDYTFGEGTPALAYVKILTAKKQNTELDIKIDDFALRSGHPISQQQFAERYNRPVPEGDDVLLQGKPAETVPPSSTPGEDPAANEGNPAEVMAAAVASDLAPVFERLDRIIMIDDAAIREQKLREFMQDFEQLKQSVLADPKSVRALEAITARSLVGAIGVAKSKERKTKES